MPRKITRNQISVLPEENFDEIFGMFDVYFLGEIKRRGWDFLLHNKENDFFIEHLVHKLYDGFEEKNVDKDNCEIKVNWDGEVRVIDLGLISKITGIPIMASRNDKKERIEFYMPFMGINCEVRDGGGIKANTVYRNVYACARWLDANVFGKSHVSSFYCAEMQVIYAMMMRDMNFCMVRTLFNVICDVKIERVKRLNLVLPLASLITLIAKEWRSVDDFEEDKVNALLLPHPKISSSYSACLHMDWVREDLEEADVPRSPLRRRERDETSSGNTSAGDAHFESGVIPDDMRGAFDFLHKGQQFIWKMLKRLAPKKKKSRKEKETPLRSKATRAQPMRSCRTARDEAGSSGVGGGDDDETHVPHWQQFPTGPSDWGAGPSS